MSRTIIQADLHNAVHAEHILTLISQYATDIMGGGEDLSADVKQRLIPSLQKRSDAVIILAFVNEEAVGLAICFEGFSTFYAKPLLNIHDFVVSASYRGQGIARQMLEEIERIAADRHCCKLTLEVLEGNVRAQSVYRKYGFKGYELDSETGKALFWDKKIV